MNYLRPVIVHGSPFWLWYRYCSKKERLAVISFDVRRESFRLLPNIGDSSGSISYSIVNNYELVNFRDSPAIMYYSKKFHWEWHKIEIYVFNERCDAWSKMSVGPFELPKPYLEPRYWVPRYFEPVQCFRNGDILFDGYTFDGFKGTCRKLYYGDLQNRTIKKLVAKKDLYYDVSVAYLESSFFIDGMKPIYDKEKEVQFFFVRKTGEDLQNLWHSSASLRAAGQDMRITPM